MCHMNVDEAVRHLRAQPEYAQLVHEAYVGADVLEAAKRFSASAEFLELVRLLGGVAGATVLDLGAGNGIASYAFAQAGAATVYALEPDPSEEVGQGAIRRCSVGTNIRILDAIGERIPLNDAQVDVVYARQVLHHIRDLPEVMREISRVLKPGGRFAACREHVVDDERQLAVFLSKHPMHRLTGGEGAHSLETYTGSIGDSGLEIIEVLGPWDSVINAFPIVSAPAELDDLPRVFLRRRLGRIGAVLARVPGVHTATSWYLRRPMPGRLYSFLGRKVK